MNTHLKKWILERFANNKKKKKKHCPKKGQLLTKGCCTGKRIDRGLRVFQYQKMQNLSPLTKHILFLFLKGQYRKCWFKCYHSPSSIVEVCAMSPVQPILNGTQLYDNKSSTEGWEGEEREKRSKKIWSSKLKISIKITLSFYY